MRFFLVAPGVVPKAVPKFSILLPVYNGERFLAAAIESALQQTVTDFELLVADDQSSDNSMAIIADFAKRDARIVYWQNENNLGLFPNYNACLARAQGVFIKPFAQDDLLEPSILEEFEKIFTFYPEVSLCSCARQSIDDKGRIRQDLRQFQESGLRNYEEVFTSFFSTQQNLVGEPSTVAYRASCAGTGFSDKYYHLGDIEYWLRIIESGQYYYVNEFLCSFRRHAGSTTSKNTRGLRFALDMVRMGKEYSAMLPKLGIAEDAYNRIVTQAVISHINHLVKSGKMSLQDFLAVEPHSVDVVEADLATFKELLFHTLITAGESLEEIYAIKQEWQAERNKLEDRIAMLMSSRSWKITAPVRDAAKLLRAKTGASLGPG